MRTGLHTYSFRQYIKQHPEFGIIQMLDATAEMGFTSIEIMTGQADQPPSDIGGDTPQHLAHVKKEAEKRGISIDCLSTYNDFAFIPNEAWRLNNIQYIKDWLVGAGDMGVENIRMLTGYYGKVEDHAKLDKLVRDGIAECIPYAERARVNMAIENHSSVYHSAESIMGLIDELKSDRLTVCPDPSNWQHADFWTGMVAPAEICAKVLESTRTVAPRMTQSHLKIKGITPDGKLMGFGDDLGPLLQIYADAGYDGPIEFEAMADGDLLEPLRDARVLVEKEISKLKK